MQRNFKAEAIQSICEKLIDRHDSLKDPNTGQYGQDIGIALLIEELKAELTDKE
jgi:hypothetical protein